MENLEPLQSSMKSELKMLKSIGLHEAPNLLLPCCELLNEEWPRSLSARMRSIECSSENFPMSLLLVDNSQNVVGHAKITKLPNGNNGCWVESVVIRKTERRKGYGRLLMTECERVARSKGFTLSFLSTTDQQTFYKSLGYEECEPINLYGLSAANKESTTNSHDSSSEVSSSEGADKNPCIVPPQQLVTPPPPPPPPLPSGRMFAPIKKTYMKKRL